MPISFDDGVSYYRELLTESDRAVVMASVAKLDHMLLDCLTCSERHRNGSRDIKHMSFSRKIDTAHEQKIIDFDLQATLHAIRRIGNVFAHDFRVRDLNDESIQAFGSMVMDPYLKYSDEFKQHLDPFTITRTPEGFSLTYRAIVSLIMRSIEDWLKKPENERVGYCSPVPESWKKSNRVTGGF